MFKNKKIRRVPLARHWTLRYLAALLIGLLIVSIVSVTWIRHTTMTNRLDTLNVIADEMSNHLTDSVSKESNADPGIFRNRAPLQNLGINPKIYIVNEAGAIISSNEPKAYPNDTNSVRPNVQAKPTPLFDTELPDDVMNGKEDVTTFTYGSNQTSYYAVKKEVKNDDDKTVGYVVLIESKKNLAHVDQEYTQVAWLIFFIGLIGTVAIYLLSRRLSEPIKEVAKAAQKIQHGDYELALPDNVKEQEVYELIESFKEMARRLKQLEATRTELLAGVTHELKTPVTSISGLLQAVKDGVVTGDDEKEFVNMALNETTKMKTMVGDLLAFNSFAVDAIPVNLQIYNLNHYVKESVMQWQMAQPIADMDIQVDVLPEERQVELDGVRFQQILTNLLTNASQAMEYKGKLTIYLEEKEQQIELYVSDSGKGIPEEEQPFIFERFYRGENKKYAVRGLGLGLALSKMMAQSLKGDLRLESSSSAGTIFCVTLPKIKES